MRASGKVAFLHDADASQDERTMELIAIHGHWGYGVFWVLVERLRTATDYRMDSRLLNGLARSLGEPADKIQALLNTCEAVGLFAREDEHFLFSPSLRRRMEAYDRRRALLSEAGRKGGLKSPQARLKPGLSDAKARPKPNEACLNTNTNTSINDPSTSLVGTDLGTNQVPDPSKPTPRKVRTQAPDELPELPPHLDTKMAREAIQQWLDYKRERGEGYKPAGLKSFIAKISEWETMQLTLAVQHSTSSNYAGLFLPKPDNGGRPAKLSNLDKAKELMRQAMEAGNE